MSASLAARLLLPTILAGVLVLGAVQRGFLRPGTQPSVERVVLPLWVLGFLAASVFYYAAHLWWRAFFAAVFGAVGAVRWARFLFAGRGSRTTPTGGGA